MRPTSISPRQSVSQSVSQSLESVRAARKFPCSTPPCKARPDRRVDRRLRTAVCSAGRVESLVLHWFYSGVSSFIAVGLHTPCIGVSGGDQHGLVFRSWRQARADPISWTVYVGHTHRAALSLELLGISHTQTGGRPAALSERALQSKPSQATKKRRLQLAISALRLAYGHIDIGSNWLLVDTQSLSLEE